MALFTGKGDGGTTYKFDSNARFSKASKITEALGTVDELNTYIGLIKVNLSEIDTTSEGSPLFSDVEVIKILHEIQKNLFIVQAELAGAEKSIEAEKVEKMSAIINQIEKEMPPITTFLIAGGSKTSAEFDLARTIARRAERRVVAVLDDGTKINQETLAYLNRLSSILYALARLYNHKFGIKESGPDYK